MPAPDPDETLAKAPTGCDRCPIPTGGPEGHPSEVRCGPDGVHRVWCTAHGQWRPCAGEPLDCGWLSL